MSGGGSRQTSYACVGALALTLYFAPGPAHGHPLLYQGVALSAALAVIVGVLRHRPRPRLPWFLFIGAQVVFAAGDVCYSLVPGGFPSVADLFYLAYYPMLGIGLLLLVRARTPGRGWTALLDSAIIATGLGLLIWLYLLEPYTRGSDGSELSRLVSIGYPVMDVILIGLAVRLTFGSPRRTPAFLLMTVSLVCMISSDIGFAFVEARGSYVDGSWVDAGWLVSYLLWGLAALHPTMALLSQPVPDPGRTLGTRRLGLMTAATLVPCLTLLTNALWPIKGFDVPMAAATAATLFVLVLGRMTGLVSELRRAVGRHEQAQRQESILRRFAADLTVTADRDAIWQAMVTGARALTADLPDARVEFASRDHRAHWVQDGALPDLALPVTAQDFVHGYLLVTSTAPVDDGVALGLRQLTDQAALALEAVALTEDLHRQRSDARVGALVQNSSDMILVVDEDLRISYVTPSVAVNTGRRTEDILGSRVDVLAEDIDEDDVLGFYRRLLKRPGESLTVEWAWRTADGRLIELEAVCTNMLDNPGVRGVVVTARDITQRKALADGLERQVAELEELDRIKSEFVATVSHELRTPLTSIVGEVELLTDGERGELTSCQEQGVGVIRRNSERLVLLIEDLLTLSHIEHRALSLNRAPTPVAGLVEGVAHQVDAAARAKDLRLSVHCADRLGTVLVDAAQLDRALLNLVTNAVKFTPAGGEVGLRATRDREDLVLVVSDTGLGIPTEEQDQLFTRFFRSSTATREAIQGTGLGLVIVKQIVEEHGGTIAVTSEPGRGTTVTVRIPIVRPEVRPEVRADAA